MVASLIWLRLAALPALILSENIPNADSIEGDRQLCRVCECVNVCQALGVQGEQQDEWVTG